MSYCVAWERENVVYMIADTAVSSYSKIMDSSKNSLGESQTKYGRYFVQEGLLKIYNLSSSMAVAFATDDVDCAMEMIELLYKTQKLVSFEELLGIFTNTYGTNSNTELILIRSQGQGCNEIYKFSEGKFEKTQFAEIGSGVQLKTLSKDVRGLLKTLSDLRSEDSHYYLVCIMSIIQCYFYRNKYFEFGVGGIITGVFLNDKIKFCRDIEYYLFEEDLRNGKTLSVINRYNSFFASSDITNAQTYFLNGILDSYLLDDSYKQRGVIKSLHTKNAFYYIFYSTKYNVMCMLEVNGMLHNIHFSRYIRRNHEKTDYAYCFRPSFINDFIRNASLGERMPTFVELEVIQAEPYLEHEVMLRFCDPNDVVEHGMLAKQHFDFDFDMFEYKNFDKSILLDIKKCISQYHNIVVINYEYFYEAVKEKMELYTPYYYFEADELDLSVMSDVFASLIPYDDFDKYLVCVVKNNDKPYMIYDYDMDGFWKKYSNVKFLKADDFQGVLFNLLKNYYLNDDFFHLDKFIIVDDDINTMDLLERILPDFNFDDRDPDILLVRNMDAVTKMRGGLRYVVIDILITTMMKLSFGDMGLLEAIAYGEIEVTEDEIANLPFNQYRRRN